MVGYDDVKKKVAEDDALESSQNVIVVMVVLESAL
jgi:hypothetical protein